MMRIHQAKALNILDFSMLVRVEIGVVKKFVHGLIIVV